jgi:hypothetical protein
MAEHKEMMDGVDPEARAVKKCYGISCHVDFVGDLKGEERVNLPEHVHHLKHGSFGTDTPPQAS